VALVKLSYIISYFYFIYSSFVNVLMVDSGIGNLVYYETRYSLSLLNYLTIMEGFTIYSTIATVFTVRRLKVNTCTRIQHIFNAVLIYLFFLNPFSFLTRHQHHFGMPPLLDFISQLFSAGCTGQIW
jgi:hypothetical protein